MKNLTAKQRAKIYRKAAEMAYDEPAQGCCIFIDKLTPRSIKNFWALKDGMELFRPSNKEQKLERPFIYAYWWSFRYSKEQNPRILALLLCAEMCLNP